MRSKLGALVGVVATVIVLLALALAWIDAWNWRVLEPLIPSSDSSSVVTIDRSTHLAPFLRSSWAAGLFWAAAVIFPIAVVVRRFALRAISRFLGAATVAVLSAIAFWRFRTIHDVQPALVFPLIGGFIGLAGFGITLWVLPPNKSLERTREG